MLEDKIVNKTIVVLNRYFHINQEVWSCDKTARIDAVIKCRESGVIFGVEFKHNEKKTGKDIGALILQVIRYSKLKFDNCQNIIPIFIAPPISVDVLICPDDSLLIDGSIYYRDRHGLNHEHHTVNGMLGSLGMGEIRNIQDSKGNYFIFSFSNQVIWSSKKDYFTKKARGLHRENYDKLIKRICDGNYI